MKVEHVKKLNLEIYKTLEKKSLQFPNFQSFAEGAVRIDLAGGTLDMKPLCWMYPEVVTLNIALNLSAKCWIQLFSTNVSDMNINHLSKDDLINDHQPSVYIYSQDYQNLEMIFLSDFFFYRKHLKDWNRYSSGFVLSLLQNMASTLIDWALEKKFSIYIKTSSDSPTGAGLGGSSALAVALTKALFQILDNIGCLEKQFQLDQYGYDHADLSQRSFQNPRLRHLLINKIQEIEAITLSRGPTGYQDYFPAFYGGINAISALPGTFHVQSLYSPQLARWLEEHIQLYYTGITRNSGVNNWEIYQQAFQEDHPTSIRLAECNEVATKMFRHFQTFRPDFHISDFKQWTQELLEFLQEESRLRKVLSPSLEIPELDVLRTQLLHEFPNIAIKVCGAGGGGCFFIFSTEKNFKNIDRIVLSQKDLPLLKKIPFLISDPI